MTLITDAGHAIPVLDNRSGLRMLVFGTGDPDTLKVPYLTSASDIKDRRGGRKAGVLDEAK